MTAAAYLTLSIDDDGGRADQALNTYLESYYSRPAETIRRYQGCFAGNSEAATQWLRGFVEAGAEHLCLRIIGDHQGNMAVASEIRRALNAV